MKAFKLGIAQTEGVNVVKSTEDLVSQYHEVFSEQLGMFHGVTASISVQKGAKPCFVKARPIPFALRDRVFEELQRMEREGVIKPVKTSLWAAPIVPVLKRDGRVWVCGDFKTTINAVTVVESYPIPKIEEHFARLRGGKKFSMLDLQDAYQQVPLDEECQELVTINTPKGLYQFTRLPFVVSSAPAIFQREMENLLHDLDHVVVYFDDILVTGTSDKDHWENLGRVLDRLKTAGLRLKLSKCEFMKPEVQYLGHIISAAGLRPNPAKTEAVLEAPAPRAVKELQSYLGMFANQGLLDVVVSDNGPAFTSELYSTFLKKNGVRRMLVPPYHPASNGAAERAVQTVKNKLRKAGPGDSRTQIARMLLTYRSTPHEVTGCCPSELLFGRKLRTALDLLHPDLRTKVLQKQLKQKIRCDQGTRPMVLPPG
nr:uncharacterized protein K02A2.6-like [Rhipicephalus microplus]